MSSGDAFHQRGTALENQFFAKVDEKLLAKLHEQQDVDSLAKSLGISPEIAKSLLAAGVTTHSAAALRLVPLVAVAWADGRIEPEELQVVVKAAESHGIKADQPAGQLLASWLKVAPTSDLLKTWGEYAASLVAHMSADQAANLKSSIIDELKSVANAAGGVLGWGAVSDGESKLMHVVEDALTRKNA